MRRKRRSELLFHFPFSEVAECFPGQVQRDVGTARQIPRVLVKAEEVAREASQRRFAPGRMGARLFLPQRAGVG